MEFLLIWLICIAVAGFIISLAVPGPVLNHMLAFVCGMALGRVVHAGKKREAFTPYMAIVASFILGYTSGSEKGSLLTIALATGAGVLLSYFMHEKGVV